MKIRSIFSMAILVFLIPLSALATKPSQYKQAQVSKTGQVPKDGYIPKDGFVPTAATAMAIALAVLEPIYGGDQLESQKPFTAELRGGVWIVQGSIERSTGVAEVDISKKTGAVLRVIHGK